MADTQGNNTECKKLEKALVWSEPMPQAFLNDGYWIS